MALAMHSTFGGRNNTRSPRGVRAESPSHQDGGENTRTGDSSSFGREKMDNTNTRCSGGLSLRRATDYHFPSAALGSAERFLPKRAASGQQGKVGDTR